VRADLAEVAAALAALTGELVAVSGAGHQGGDRRVIAHRGHVLPGGAATAPPAPGRWHGRGP
jgi:hypothetical protein